jgi:hypothetical protein
VLAVATLNGKWCVCGYRRLHLFLYVLFYTHAHSLWLKTFQLGMWQFAVMHMHGAKFSAAVQGRDGLAGV